MSPEMINEEDYDFKTDVFSFGIVLYAMFVGTVPRQNIKDKSLGKAISIPSASESMSEYCRTLISKCLSPDPRSRPTFSEIQDDMKKNNYQLADNVNHYIISQHDEELTAIENILKSS